MQTDDPSATADFTPRPPSPRPSRSPRSLEPVPPRRARKTRAPEFPGCRPVPLRRSDLDNDDRRFEYWDGDTETAWLMRDPTGISHEQPSQRLASLCASIGAARGAPIECFGSFDLELRDERNVRRRILQADQSVYLYPERARLPEGGGLVVGEHDFPDVVVEVDHTTDVRRGKLGLYEEWGFPELWVEVPDRYSPSRRAGLRPGLTIHLREGGAYRPAPVSRAFPGWTAVEVHRAMNEAAMSVATSEVLVRVGRAPGARDGTGPDDAPWLRLERQEARAEGYARGRQEARAEGYAQGRAAARATGPGRTTTRFSAPRAPRSGRRWSAGPCCRAASRSPRDFPPPRPASPNRRKTRRSPQPSPAAASGTSTRVSASPDPPPPSFGRTGRLPRMPLPPSSAPYLERAWRRAGETGRKAKPPPEPDARMGIPPVPSGLSAGP